MKKFFAVLFLLLCSTTLIYGQKPRFGQTPEKPDPANYPIQVHVSASHMLHYCFSTGGCSNELHAEATLNGRKFDLTGTTALDKHNPVLLTPGDYPARLTRDFHSADNATFYQEFDVLLPGGAIWHCNVTGISE